jgi:NAD(P)-dependent dehydrogenase (short-subunit alcohol dehydrogenase family)
MFTKDELHTCLRVLEAIAGDRGPLAALDEETRRRLMTASGQVSRPGRDEQRQLHRAFRKQDRARKRSHDDALLARAVNRAARRSSTFVLPASTARALPEAGAPAAELAEPRDCYVCKAPFRRLHAFYDSLCPPCAELNWQKRHQTADLTGRVALVTGARIKIGYEAALMLLRAGARVIATTRFPDDARERYAREPDFPGFRDRLTVHGVDLRHLPSVEQLAQELSDSLPSLDFLVNNAAQTVRRPSTFYRGLLQAGSQTALTRFMQLALDTEHGEDARDADKFPAGLLDLDGQQADLREHNSWRLRAHEVSTVELLEVHLVNAIAPFMLVSQLRPLMQRRPERDKHIVNVSAMEAQFSRNKKTDKHPHTNMAKAALNMLTRTSAVDFERDGIFMNSVDTGWITDEDPLVHVARKQVEHDFHPPLDAIDGAARVLDPIFTGHSTGEHPWGLFLKDYRPIPW